VVIVKVRVGEASCNALCGPEQVGEIWVAGPSVARGYWNRSEETALTFGGRVAGEDGPFLRTGDLGFLRSGHLFVAGRQKELIIIRGRNYYPQDIEAGVSPSPSALSDGSCSAIFVLPRCH